MPEEFANSRPYVIQELCGLDAVRAVIVLGKVAFDQYLKACRAMGLAPPRPALRFTHGAVYHLPWKIVLLCSFHPSQQNTFTGRLTQPMFHSVFERARALLAEPASPAI